MTTIAYDPKSRKLAADTRMTVSDGGEVAYCTYGTKFVDTPRGKVAAAGDVGDIARFIEWMERVENKKPPRLKNFCALVIDDGHLFFYDELVTPVPHDLRYPTAIGSGAKCALTAMGMGATAAEAIREAMRWDPATGGEIEEFPV